MRHKYIFPCRRLTNNEEPKMHNDFKIVSRQLRFFVGKKRKEKDLHKTTHDIEP